MAVKQDTGVAVVLGANRGIGLQLCKVLQKQGYVVLAACRKASPALNELGAHKVLEGVDICIPGGMKPVLRALEDQKVALLIVVAGYQHLDSLADVNADGLRQHFEVNSIGPLLAVQALRPWLVSGTKVVLLGSKMGSCGDGRTGGGLYGYRMSKAALNSAGATLAHDLRADGIHVAIIHPGAVDTDMCRSIRAAMGVPEANRSKGLLQADDSARRVVTMIDRLDADTSCTFWAADTGEVLSW
ncbi:hypothetical protein WJX81_000380 [Elliptochloris bilobata]|uniref:Short-chain dehydrogenase n=1 Tax=Elliptochloris bilobata TaxID=381761 RepID=A0AAW1RGJ3_9CHLO